MGWPTTSLIREVVPRRVRRGLARAYLVIAVPSVLWFGFQIIGTISSRYYWHWRDISHAVSFLLFELVAVPAIYVLTVWIIAGFSEPPPPAADYRPLLLRAISQLPENNPASRAKLYERAAVALTEHLRRKTPKMLDSHITNETEELRRTTRELEREISTAERKWQASTKGSTALLFVAALGFPVLWVLDFTSMSLYWIARPKC